MTDDLLDRVKAKLQAKYNVWKLADGTKLFLEVDPLSFGRARLIVTDGRTTVEKFWEYGTIMLAQLAGLLWEHNDMQGEPEGWRRAHNPEHPMSVEKLRRKEHGEFWTDEDGVRMFAENPDLLAEFLNREGMPFPMSAESDLHVNPVMLHLAVQSYKQRSQGEDHGPP